MFGPRVGGTFLANRLNAPTARRNLMGEMTDPADRLYERVQVLRAQAGDAAAFADLVGRYHARLRYYLRKLLVDPQGVDDVLQDVWLDVWRGLSRLRDAAAFPAWLYRLTRDRAMRTFRLRFQPRQFELVDDVAEPDEGDEFTAEDAARVHAALDALGPELREVLVLRFLEEMVYTDIARVVGCPVGTVRSRLHHAKRALRRELERTMTRD
jgi:RNA polymerase sigma-70 factor, ECF subfamily